jgi:signal transduction histidine kinase
VRLFRIVNTATFRLTALNVLLFAVAVIVLGVIVYLTTIATLEGRLDGRIAGEMTTLKTAFAAGGMAKLVPEVRAHQLKPPAGSLKYLLLGPDGARLAGNLPMLQTQAGWSTVKSHGSDGDITRYRILTAALAGGARLAVGANREEIDETEQTIFDAALTAFAAVIGLGIIGGIALSNLLLHRVDSIRRTADAIIAGDFTRRVPVRGSGDDFDRLSLTLNRMLDRIGELMETLRQVSSDIAHDLKTPLAHLRQGLEATQRQAKTLDEQNAAIDLAISKSDEILAIFNALLRTAQIEAGTRCADFHAFDLSAVFVHVAGAFVPAATDAGKTLDTVIEPAIKVVGDRELITQMLANLVENAIHHTPKGTRIAVSLDRERGRIIGAVSDDGLGVPPQERQRIFQRLYRLERSRSTPGSGLGLSLVKAVADLNGIALEILDAGPGLRIVMRFPDEPGTRAPQRS